MAESQLRGHEIPMTEEQGEERPAEEQGGGEEAGREQRHPVGKRGERCGQIRAGEEEGGERAEDGEGQWDAAQVPPLTPDRGVVEERAQEGKTQGRSAQDGPATERTDRMKHEDRSRKAQEAQYHEGVHL